MNEITSHRGWIVGDAVTVKTAVDGYYSGYAGNPVFSFKPGQVGTIAAVKVPKVRIVPPDTYAYFMCVDWQCPETGKVERCSVHYDNIVKLERNRPGSKPAGTRRTRCASTQRHL